MILCNTNPDTIQLFNGVYEIHENISYTMLPDPFHMRGD